MTDEDLLFYSLMLLVLILGLFWMLSLISVTMLLVLYENKLSKYVITSIFDHWDTFLITLAVGFICFYWFSVITFFSSWRGEYAIEDQMVNYIYIYIYRIVTHYWTASEFTWTMGLWDFRCGMSNHCRARR